MGYCYENMCEILNVTFIFKNFERNFESKKNWKNSHEFWKINKLIWNKKKCDLFIFREFVNNFLVHCYENMCKIGKVTFILKNFERNF